MARQPAEKIDRDKLRTAIRKLRNEYRYYLLLDAIDFLPPTKLHKLAKSYFDLKQLRPDSECMSRPSLLAEVKVFEEASLAGEYYESFDVNSKNFTEMSSGTTVWIADCNRLLDRCVKEQRKGNPVEVRQAFDIIFGLLDHIDECHDDVIFFADEAGSWQVGVDWNKVLPPWFKVLSATAEPDEYAGHIAVLVGNHVGYDRDKMLMVARRAGNPEQRKALAKAIDHQGSRG
jgi:hypothetical protein